MKRDTWLAKRTIDPEGAWAFVFSLAFHALLLAVLAQPSNYLPLTGSTARFELLWWLPVSSVSLDALKEPSPPPAADRMVAGAGGAKATGEAPQGGKPVTAAVASPDESNGLPPVEEYADAETTIVQAVAVSSKSREPATSERPAEPQGAAVLPATVPKGTVLPSTVLQRAAVLPPTVPQGAAVLPLPAKATDRRGEGFKSELAKPPAGVLARKESTTAPVADTPPVAATPFPGPKAKPETLAPAPEPVMPVRHVLEKPIPEPRKATASATVAVPPVLTKADVTAPTTPSQPTDPRDKAAAGSKQPKEEERSTEKAAPRQLINLAEKLPVPTGLVLPMVRGDLELIVVGGNDINLTFLFRDYPKSRRNRGQSRIEGRRTRKVAPIVVKTKEQERRAVVKTTMDGVYILVAETGDGHSTEALFILELFGQSGSGRIKPLGSMKISGRKVIAKILMPEGIIWEDESAFTGSMVDSESTTKFNSSSGLVWKEYDD